LAVDLDSLIALTIEIDGHLRERRNEMFLFPGLGHTRSPAMARSPSKESGSSRRQFPREDPKPRELPRELSMMGELDSPEPMQLGRARLSVEEHSRRLNCNCCLYCGGAGHYIATCPVRKPHVSGGYKSFGESDWEFPNSHHPHTFLCLCCGETNLSLSECLLTLGQMKALWMLLLLLI
jgi:hypothetical protein